MNDIADAHESRSECDSEEVARLLMRARRHEANASSAALWIHPDWQARVFGAAPAVTAKAAGLVAGLSTLLLAGLEVPTPPFDALAPARASIPLLPPALAMRAWHMRALMERTGEVRHTIDRAGRGFIDACLGDSASAFHAASHGLLSELPRPSPLADRDPARLAWEGWQLCERDDETRSGTARADGPASLARLALASDLPSSDARPDARVALVFQLALPSLFPEYAWLFG